MAPISKPKNHGVLPRAQTGMALSRSPHATRRPHPHSHVCIAHLLDAPQRKAPIALDLAMRIRAQDQALS